MTMSMCMRRCIRDLDDNEKRHDGDVSDNENEHRRGVDENGDEIKIKPLLLLIQVLFLIFRFYHLIICAIFYVNDLGQDL